MNVISWTARAVFFGLCDVFKIVSCLLNCPAGADQVITITITFTAAIHTGRLDNSALRQLNMCPLQHSSTICITQKMNICWFVQTHGRSERWMPFLVCKFS